MAFDSDDDHKVVTRRDLRRALGRLRRDLLVVIFAINVGVNLIPGAPGSAVSMARSALGL